MGLETMAALCRDPDLEAAGAVDITPMDGQYTLPDSITTIPYATSLAELLPRCQAEVVVDFSNASACVDTAWTAAMNGLHLVIGTSGLSDADLEALGQLSDRYHVGIIVAPNFALGAVVLNHVARIASRFFDYADIIEAHHEAKIDAPSGTAIALAKAMAAEKHFNRPEPEKEPLSGTRGGSYKGISIHSMRMPGRLAHHEVVLGALGQTLTISHDTLSRECFMPAVMLAVKEVVKRRDLVVGLEEILGLS